MRLRWGVPALVCSALLPATPSVALLIDTFDTPALQTLDAPGSVTVAASDALTGFRTLELSSATFGTGESVSAGSSGGGMLAYTAGANLHSTAVVAWDATVAAQNGAAFQLYDLTDAGTSNVVAFDVTPSPDFMGSGIEEWIEFAYWNTQGEVVTNGALIALFEPKFTVYLPFLLQGHDATHVYRIEFRFGGEQGALFPLSIDNLRTTSVPEPGNALAVSLGIGLLALRPWLKHDRAGRAAA